MNAYEVEFPCEQLFASSQSGDVIIEKSAWGHLLFFGNLHCSFFDAGKLQFDL